MNQIWNEKKKEEDKKIDELLNQRQNQQAAPRHARILQIPVAEHALLSKSPHDPPIYFN